MAYYTVWSLVVRRKIYGLTGQCIQETYGDGLYDVYRYKAF
jgi:hypothetical protein